MSLTVWFPCNLCDPCFYFIISLLYHLHNIITSCAVGYSIALKKNQLFYWPVFSFAEFYMGAAPHTSKFALFNFTSMGIAPCVVFIFWWTKHKAFISLFCYQVICGWANHFKWRLAQTSIFTPSFRKISQYDKWLTYHWIYSVLKKFYHRSYFAY
jgi:hypothetical protein